MRIIVGITAASGQIYAKQVVTLLLEQPNVEQIAVIYSSSARAVAEEEGGVTLPESDRIVEYACDDMFAPVASGSAAWDGMVVVPCSVGTVGRIAHGVSDSLLSRAADVMLKERRRLVLVVREMPLSLIHLRNMVTVTEAGGVVMPASPSLYGGECDFESLTLTVSRRAVSLLGIDGVVKQWDGKKSCGKCGYFQ